MAKTAKNPAINRRVSPRSPVRKDVSGWRRPGRFLSGHHLPACRAPDLEELVSLAVPWLVLPADGRADSVNGAECTTILPSSEERAGAEGETGRVMPVRDACYKGNILLLDCVSTNPSPAGKTDFNVDEDVPSLSPDPGDEVCGSTLLPPAPPLAAAPALPAFLIHSAMTSIAGILYKWCGSVTRQIPV